MAEKIKTITIKGKEYPVWGGFYALEKFELLTGDSADQVTASVTNSVTFTWCSIWAGAKMMEKECELTLDDFKKLVNEDMSVFLDIQRQSQGDKSKNQMPPKQRRPEQ